MQNNYPYPYMGKKDERFPNDLHGDLPYADDPIFDPFTDRAWNEKDEAGMLNDLPEVGETPENPPVPNRAWTEMKNGKDIDDLSEEEKRDLYLGHDAFD